MPEQVNPEDISAADEDIAAELQSATVSDVLLALEQLQLTVDLLLLFVRNIVRIALLASAVLLLSCALAVVLP